MRIRTLNEAADALGTNRARLRRGVLDGRYPYFKWGNRYLVDLDTLGPIIEQEDAEKDEPRIGLRECAAEIGVTPGVLRRMVLDGIVPCRIVGGHYQFRAREVIMALNSRMENSKEE